MPFHFFNTLGRTMQVFEPLETGKVGFYGRSRKGVRHRISMVSLGAGIHHW
ncbi:MAG: hypothetical protein FWG89_04635 [Treponema sp.]|nr:hypothetical protein [Treponema sp.]